MINLLPENYKERLKTQKKWNFFLSLELFISLIVFISAVGLFVIEIYFSAMLDYQKSVLESIRSNSKETQDLLKEFSDINQFIHSANSIIDKQESVSVNFSNIIDSMPKNIVFKSFSFSKKENDINFSIVGNSPDNQLLVEFNNNLEKVFSQKISLPLDSLTKRKDIDFTINFSIPAKK